MGREILSSMTLRTALLAAVFGSSLLAQNPDWTTPFTPHKVMGNLYYVGSKDLAAYLITTPEGHILINSNLESSPPLIRASVEKLGFKMTDIKILLISHAHSDHCAGSAAIREMTAAKHMVMEGDAAAIEAGNRSFKPVKVDRVLHDGDEVKLGDAVLVARHTPGHTPGTTTWTTKVSEAGKTYNVVIVGSPNVNAGYVLVGNTAYPQIAQDYEKSFKMWKAMPCDIFLGAHGAYYGLVDKFARMKPGAANPFVDPEGYKSYIDEREKAFRAELAKQSAAKK
jgi:metallo-beta-lactamase class B